MATRGVGRVSDLYAAGAILHLLPFREHRPPREYVTEAFDDQAEAVCRFGSPIVDGDRAAVDWWGVITSRDGSVESIAGTSLLRFGDDGSVVEQRDAWESVPGHRELPGWAS